MSDLVCQVHRVNVSLLTCPARESGGYRCERTGEHEDHRIGRHTVEHSLIGNGYACSAVTE